MKLPWKIFWLLLARQDHAPKTFQGLSKQMPDAVFPAVFHSFGLMNKTSARSIQPFLRSTRNQPSLFFL